MKKLFYSILFIAYSIIGFSQSDTTFVIEGTIYDELTGDSLENVQVFLVKDKMRIDSMFSNEAGKYRFEIFEDGCYDLRSEFPSYLYLSRTTDKCYEFEKGKSAEHDFWLSKLITSEEILEYEKSTYVYKIPIKILVRDENNEIIKKVQLKAFYDNNVRIYTIENGEIIINYNRGKKLTLEIEQQGFQKQIGSFYFPLDEGCIINYIDPNRQKISNFQKVYFTLEKIK